MASRCTVHSKLSAIMETMAKSVLSQVCKVVDEDSAEFQLELSRLLVANSALADKVNNLEGELAAVRSREQPGMRKSQRSVGIQTIIYRDGDDCVSKSPTIAGIFGKDWCMNLWKDGKLCCPERTTDSLQSPEKPVVNPTETREDFVKDTSSSCQQETLSKQELEANVTEDPDQVATGFLADSSMCSLPFDQSSEPAVSVGAVEEPSMQFTDTGESSNPYIIPIEDDDDDDDVQFVQESQQELTVSASDGASHSKQQTLPANLSESTSALKESSHSVCNTIRDTTNSSEKESFTCSICNRTFFHKGTLTQHMKSHKSSFCSICKQKFSNKNKLHSHTCVPPTASKRDSRSCQVCGKKFANPSAVRIHSVVHTGEKPYRCNLCGKSFTQKGNLKCHQRIHTGEKPFYCYRCGKTFSQKINLSNHLMAHNNLEAGQEMPDEMP